MTVQATDFALWKNQKWSICDVGPNWSFDPVETFKLNTRSPSSACWRGYVCGYETQDTTLCLKFLGASIEGDIPEINGIRGNPDQESGLKGARWVEYDNLNFTIDFSGGIVIGRDFLDGYRMSLGGNPAYLYQRVEELTFQDGNMIATHDRSRAMQRVRNYIDKKRPKGEHNDFPNIDKPHRWCINELTEIAFSHDYYSDTGRKMKERHLGCYPEIRAATQREVYSN